MSNADDLISSLGLISHPEGGHFRQTWVARAPDGQRPAGTCIYFLLKQGEVSHWHRVDAVEIWHFYAGAPLILSLSETDDGPAHDCLLGTNFARGEEPQRIVPEGFWQAARSTGEYTLVGCTVSPGFQFEGFDLAPSGFDIAR